MLLDTSYMDYFPDVVEMISIMFCATLRNVPYNMFSLYGSFIGAPKNIVCYSQFILIPTIEII
jgi:hypothetical protein